jgi:hypothetical protein
MHHATAFLTPGVFSYQSCGTTATIRNAGAGGGRRHSACRHASRIMVGVGGLRAVALPRTRRRAYRPYYRVTRHQCPPLPSVAGQSSHTRVERREELHGGRAAQEFLAPVLKPTRPWKAITIPCNPIQAGRKLATSCLSTCWRVIPRWSNSSQRLRSWGCGERLA